MAYYVGKDKERVYHYPREVYRVINTEPPYEHYFLEDNEFAEFKKSHQVIEAEFAYLTIFDEIYDEIALEEIKTISFEKMTQDNIVDYLMKRMISEDIVSWKKDDELIIIAKNKRNKGTIVLYFNTVTKKLTIKYDSDFLILNSEEIFRELEWLEEVDFSGVYASLLYYSNCFEGCYSLKELDLTHLDFSNATSLEKMFSGCSSLKHIKFNNGNMYNCVTEIECMFEDCENLQEIDLTMFDFDKVRDSKSMELDNISALTDYNLKSYKSKNIELVIK